MKLKDFDFRIWDNVENKYIEAKSYLCIAKKDNNKDCERILDVANDCSGYDDISFNNYTDDRYDIELFTGLCNKNGKKIYEGDILYYFFKNESYKFKVVFKEGAFYLIEFDDGGEECDEDLISEFLLSEMEIIGNIHENAKLLK
ncbi:TPA: hypothetical protein RZH69_001789 [Campylobacter coli]|uniref:YopX family protein n=1 Tax=Campylobacter coli TaxID=195 RepID=UPI00092FD6FD|nr:YopX family protein [Campylobacter coli]HEB7554775.1 hypothetical protein [Campylobacter coli]HEB7556326.1 hypothetical protein [Campylobacter coli]